MTKSSEKEPNEAAGAPAKPFQIPEVGPTPPNPIDMVAVTVPRAGTPFPKGKSPVPSPSADFDPDDVQRSRANVLTPILTLSRPALGRFTAMGTEMVGDCAIANGLGIREPVKMKVTFSEDYKWCFLMPVHHTGTKAVKVTYNKGQANINLWGPFEGRNKIVEKGFRETYDLWMTDEPIKIQEVTGYALYFSMEGYEKEPLTKRGGDSAPAGQSTTTASAGSSKASMSSPAPKATSQPAEKASSAPESEESTTQLEMLEAELAEAAQSTQLYLDMLDQKDAQIKELQGQMKALQERQGQG